MLAGVHVLVRHAHGAQHRLLLEQQLRGRPRRSRRRLRCVCCRRRQLQTADVMLAQVRCAGMGKKERARRSAVTRADDAAVAAPTSSRAPGTSLVAGLSQVATCAMAMRHTASMRSRGVAPASAEAARPRSSTASSSAAPALGVAARRCSGGAHARGSNTWRGGDSGMVSQPTQSESSPGAGTKAQRFFGSRSRARRGCPGGPAPVGTTRAREARQPGAEAMARGGEWRNPRGAATEASGPASNVSADSLCADAAAQAGAGKRIRHPEASTRVRA